MGHRRIVSQSASENWLIALRSPRDDGLERLAILPLRMRRGQIAHPDEIRVPGWQADIDARSTTVLHRGFAGSRLFGSPHDCDRILASFVGRAAAFLSRNRPGLPLVAARRHLLLQLGWMAALGSFRPDTHRFGDYRRARYIK